MNIVERKLMDSHLLQFLFNEYELLSLPLSSFTDEYIHQFICSYQSNGEIWKLYLKWYLAKPRNNTNQGLVKFLFVYISRSSNRLIPHMLPTKRRVCVCVCACLCLYGLEVSICHQLSLMSTSNSLSFSTPTPASFFSAIHFIF